MTFVIAIMLLFTSWSSYLPGTDILLRFSEIIPQSLCTRYGLAIGAQMAWFVRLLILCIVRLPASTLRRTSLTLPQGIVSWPVAKLMEFILGPHHGIMYRRAGKCARSLCD